MNFKVYDHSTNYTCTVIKLPVKQPVPGLDNLVKVEVFGNSCLIGKDSDPEDIYLFFPAESCLSSVYLKNNNLYREPQMNADLTKKGFFELNGRVKALKFKGIISSGFVIPASSLLELFDFSTAQALYGQLKVGEDFNEIDGVEICRKYIPSNTVTPGEPGSKKDKETKINNQLKDLLLPNQFRFHSDTTHLAKVLGTLNEEDIILISDKWHGSSCILSKVFINKKLNWYQKLINKIGGNIPNKELGYIYSSGKPKSALPKMILSAEEKEHYKNTNTEYYSTSIWKKAFEDYKYALEDGITIYSELVGFTEGGSYIQKNYDYGCLPGQYKMVVYRITYTKPDGSVIEFSWQQIKDYCAKYQLETVKEFYFGKLGDFIEYRLNWSQGKETMPEEKVNVFFEYLQTAFNMTQTDKYCASKVPAEGLILRLDGKSTFSAYKLKSKKFLLHETEELNSGDVNIEDQI